MPDKHTQNRLLAYSTPLILALILLAFVVGVTLTGDKALARTAAETLVRVTLVVGLWIFVGNSGVISFGHAGYMAIGAYCSAWLTLKPQAKALFLPDLPAWLANAEWHVFPAAIASGLLAAFVALISGAAILRLSGIAASIATFAFLAIVYTVYSNWEGVTGATSSVVGLTRYVGPWVALAWAWSWTQQQYYVGEQDGSVVIYRGINTELAGISLSDPYETTDVQLDRLSEIEADRVREGIAYDNLADAEAKVQDLAARQAPPDTSTDTSTSSSGVAG